MSLFLDRHSRVSGLYDLLLNLAGISATLLGLLVVGAFFYPSRVSGSLSALGKVFAHFVRAAVRLTAGPCAGS